MLPEQISLRYNASRKLCEPGNKFIHLMSSLSGSTPTSLKYDPTEAHFPLFNSDTSDGAYQYRLLISPCRSALVYVCSRGFGKQEPHMGEQLAGDINLQLLPQQLHRVLRKDYGTAPWV